MPSLVKGTLQAVIRIASLLVISLLVASCSGPSAAGSPGAASSAAASASANPSVHLGATPESTPGDTAALSSDPLHTVQLYDVVSGQPFTLGQLAVDRPVLLEAMAVWCTNCRQQQDQVRAAHQMADFSSVSLDIDPTETNGDLREFAQRQEYDWRFAKANQELARLLRDRFGTAVLNPPSTPKIVLLPDGSVRLLDYGQILDAASLTAALGL